MDFTSGSIQSENTENEELNFLTKLLRDALNAFNVQSLLRYGEATGSHLLKKQIATQLIGKTQNGKTISENEIIVFSSSQQALNAIFEVVLSNKQKRKFFIQDPGYFGSLRLIRKYEVEVVSFSSVSSILSQISKGDVIYITSNFQNPTGDSLSSDDKVKLSQVVSEQDALIIEDNPYDLVFYGEEKPNSLFHICNEHTIYTSGFSKCLGPGIRVGFTVCCNGNINKELKSKKIDQDIFTSQLSQFICSFALERIDYLEKLRSYFRHKRDLALKLLEKYLGFSKEISWKIPEGGIFITLTISETSKLTMEKFLKFLEPKVKVERLEFYTIDYYRGKSSEYSKKNTRINFVQNSDEILEKGIQEIANSLRKSLEISSNVHKVIVTNLGNEELTNNVVGSLVSKGFEVEYLSDKDSIPLRKGVQVHSAGNFDEFSSKLKTLLESKPKAIVYSDQSSRGHSLLSNIKKWNPLVFLINYNETIIPDLQRSIDESYKIGIQNHCNLNIGVTSNVFASITPEKGVSLNSRDSFPDSIAETIHQRSSEKHYKTLVTDSSEYLSNFKTEVELFVKNVSILYRLNMFEEYFPSANKHFGFLAIRVKEGFLISSRASNKKNLPLDDIVYVPRVDFANRIVYVHSQNGKKSSLNANVAAKLFEEFPDVHVLVHGHIFPGVPTKTELDYSPGTEEDVVEVTKHMKNTKTLELVNHGILIMGKDLDEIKKQLLIEPAYTRFSHFYDLIYDRFQQSTDFLDLVKKVVKQDLSVLDLAGGTGQVTLHLAQNGFVNLTLGDKNKGMMDVAMKNLEKFPVKFVQTDMHSLQNVNEQYDAIVIRQAVNYLMTTDGLALGFKNMHSHLNLGGFLIFNAPNYQKEDKSIETLDRELSYESKGYKVRVMEKNYMEGNILSHTQQCIITKVDGTERKKIYDINRFGMFTKEEFEEALVSAGFSEIKFFGKGIVPITKDSKSLYCVAKK